jgi:putative pyrroloquinoline-quinone binding quinoprotein
LIRRLIATLVAVLALVPIGAAADWTTYHFDNSRAANDTTEPPATSIGPDWTSQPLDGEVYAEPLLTGNTLFVATENDSIYGLDAPSGRILWRTSLGTPVPQSSLPCGNISSVGITGTPAIDLNNGRIYAVAQVRYPSIHYELYALTLTSGAIVFHEPIAPSGFDPFTQGQRGALVIANGQVYIPFGGRYGDCTPYSAWVVGANEAGPAALTVWERPIPNGRNGGGIWAGSGLAADASGNIYAATGNTFCSSGCSFDYGETVVKLSPALGLSDYFAPSNWASLNASDTDLGSVGPAVLTSALLFQVGKEGIGYLLSTASLGGANHNTPAFSARVCAQTADASFGGIAYDPTASRLYVPCTNGLIALDVNTTTPSFAATAGWTAPSSSLSTPPILAAGLVWTIDPGGNVYALDAATGATKFSMNVGRANHFATPSAGGGRIFVPAGNQISAFNLQWAQWQSLGGGLSSAPDATSTASGHLDVFARGMDGALWQQSFNGTSWSGWMPLGGYITSDPTAVSPGSGHIDVLARGGDGALWHRVFDGTAWGNWASLGGGMVGGPDGSSWGSGHEDVFIRGLDNALWQITFDGTNWGMFTSLGGQITSDPSAVSQAVNSIDVFGRGGDGAVWHRSFTGTWSAWDTLGGGIVGAPDVSSWGAGRMDLFVRGTDLALWHRPFTGTWGNWQALGGHLTSDPSAISWGPNRIDVFGKGSDNAIWHRGFVG